MGTEQMTVPLSSSAIYLPTYSICMSRQQLPTYLPTHQISHSHPEKK